MLGATAWSLGLTVGGLVNPLGFWLFKALTVGAYFLFFTSGLHFALAFNKLRLAQAPRFIALLYAAPYAFYTLYVIAAKAVAASALDWLRLWTPGEGIVPIVYLLIAIAAAIFGYRINRDPVVRQQFRWVLWAVMVSGGGGLILWNLPEYILGHKIIGPNALGLIVLPFPIALAAAILRYRLFDIDIILNRTLVYGALTAGTMGIYVLIVGYLGDLFQARDRTAIAFLTTGLVAVIFQPLRERLQRAVNRLMYGERDEPYTILSRLGQRLKSTLAPDSILPTIVETVAQTLKLPYAAISLRDADTDKIAAAFGLPTPNTLALPLTYQHELIGHLHIARRSPDEPFTPAERRLLEDIARETEVAARAMRLTADLQRSRERLVTTREEERRRLRRDLHDGLGPTLASQSYKLDAVLDLMDSDPATARKLILDLKSQAQTTLADIRRLIYELRPPALDELGLVAALQAQFTDSANGLRISVESPPDGLPPLSAAVEVAAYRIAMEAVNNATRHAKARHCVIRFGAKVDELTVEITDDGTGLQGGMRAGVGLTSMRERAAELGGQCVIDSSPKRGTRVCAILPLAKEAP
jgi:signal transduction histidine kinase